MLAGSVERRLLFDPGGLIEGIGRSTGRMACKIGGLERTTMAGDSEKKISDGDSQRASDGDSQRVSNGDSQRFSDGDSQRFSDGVSVKKCGKQTFFTAFLQRLDGFSSHRRLESWR